MIQINKINKKYGNKNVLDNLDLSFCPYQIHAILGPNGSGKTTLLKCLFEEINYQGQIIIDREWKESAYFFKDVDRIDSLISGKEFVLTVSKMYPNWDKDKFKYQIENLSSLFDMEEAMNKPLNSYSHGMLKKITIIAGLCSNTRLYVFDEPFNGLDYEYQIILKKLFRVLIQSKKTIILTSHNLDLIEDLADTFLILKEGKMVYNQEAKKGIIQKGELAKLFVEKSDLMSKINIDSYDFTKLL